MRLLTSTPVKKRLRERRVRERTECFMARRLIASDTEEDEEREQGPSSFASRSDNRQETQSILPEFESCSSSLAERMVSMLESLDPNEEWKQTSDPKFEDVIFDLIGEDTKFNNPFSLTCTVRDRMVEEAERTVARAMNWVLESYDKVGGKNTLRGIWAVLKGSKRVVGVKRGASTGTESDNNNNKECLDQTERLRRYDDEPSNLFDQDLSQTDSELVHKELEVVSLSVYENE